MLINISPSFPVRLPCTPTETQYNSLHNNKFFCQIRISSITSFPRLHAFYRSMDTPPNTRNEEELNDQRSENQRLGFSEGCQHSRAFHYRWCTCHDITALRKKLRGHSFHKARLRDRPTYTAEETLIPRGCSFPYFTLQIPYHI